MKAYKVSFEAHGECIEYAIKAQNQREARWKAFDKLWKSNPQGRKDEVRRKMLCNAKVEGEKEIQQDRKILETVSPEWEQNARTGRGRLSAIPIDRPKNWRRSVGWPTARKESHKTYFHAYNAHRRAAKLQRTPQWADQEEIKRIYSNCPDGHHVDHIIPLQGKRVSGLHVPGNLQYLRPAENGSKGNRFEG